MTPEIFAEWMRRQGHRVVRTASTYWHSQGPGAYQAFPYHWIIQPSAAELNEFVREHRVLALRHSTAVNSPFGCLSYHVVRDEPSYGLSSLSRSARYEVRYGQRQFEVVRISFERLECEGWALEQDTLDRQGRILRNPKRSWRLKCMSAAEVPGFEAWAAVSNGRLAASQILFQMQDFWYLVGHQSLRQYLNRNVTSALTFAVTQKLLGRPGVKGILAGLHSLDAPPSVDSFKFRMGYRAKPVRQRVMFNPWLAPFMNRTSCALLKMARAVLPGRPLLSKTEGMVRFYLEGRLPARQQARPACLENLAVE
jgi:hypothetical protein